MIPFDTITRKVKINVILKLGYKAAQTSEMLLFLIALSNLKNLGFPREHKSINTGIVENDQREERKGAGPYSVSTYSLQPFKQSALAFLLWSLLCLLTLILSVFLCQLLM